MFSSYEVSDVVIGVSIRKSLKLYNDEKFQTLFGNL